MTGQVRSAVRRHMLHRCGKPPRPRRRRSHRLRTSRTRPPTRQAPVPAEYPQRCLTLRARPLLSTGGAAPVRARRGVLVKLRLCRPELVAHRTGQVGTHRAAPSGGSLLARTRICACRPCRPDGPSLNPSTQIHSSCGGRLATSRTPVTHNVTGPSDGRRRSVASIVSTAPSRTRTSNTASPHHRRHVARRRVVGSAWLDLKAGDLREDLTPRQRLTGGWVDGVAGEPHPAVVRRLVADRGNPQPQRAVAAELHRGPAADEHQVARCRDTRPARRWCAKRRGGRAIHGPSFGSRSHASTHPGPASAGRCATGTRAVQAGPPGQGTGPLRPAPYPPDGGAGEGVLPARARAGLAVARYVQPRHADRLWHIPPGDPENPSGVAVDRGETVNRCAGQPTP